MWKQNNLQRGSIWGLQQPWQSLKKGESVSGSLWTLRKWKHWRQHWKPRKQARCSVKRIGHPVSRQVAEDIWDGEGDAWYLTIKCCSQTVVCGRNRKLKQVMKWPSEIFYVKKPVSSFIACVWVSNESHKWRVLWLLGLEAERWRYLPWSGFEGVLLPLGSHLSWEWKWSQIITEWHPQPIFNHSY